MIRPLALVALLALALLGRPAPAHACTAADLAKLVEAIGQTEVKRRPELAAFGLKLACPAWPAPILQALDAMGSAPPDMRPMFEAKAVAEAPAVWMRGCPGGIQVAIDTARLPAEAKRGHVYRACGLNGLGFATRAEFEAGTGAVLLPAPLAMLLEQTTLSKADRRTVLRALAGVATPAERQAAQRAARRDRLELPRFRRIRDPFLAGGQEPEPETVPREVPFDPSAEFGADAGLVVQAVTAAPDCPVTRADAIRTRITRIARACREGERSPTVPVAFSLRIDAAGQISDLQPTRGDFGGPALAACLADRLGRQRLGPASGECQVTIEALRPR